MSNIEFLFLHVCSMHGTVEWLPGQPLGNDRKSWSDELLGDLPNIYIYAANNPSGKLYNQQKRN